MEVDIRCPICKQEYKQQKFPRLLDCGHTFCESCLDTLLTENEDGTYRITCSEDDESYNLQTNDINQFSKNITLFKIVQSVRNINISFKDDQSLLDISKVKHNKDDELENESEKQLLDQIQGQQLIQQHMEIFKKQEKKDNQQNQSKQHIQGQKQQIQQIKVQEVKVQQKIQHMQNIQKLPKVQKTEKIQKKQQKKEEQICMFHNKVLDLVCIQDMVRVCAKCAIFGQHKGHQLKPIQAIQQQWIIFQKKVQNIQKQKHVIQTKISEQYKPKQIISIYDEKKKIMQGKIKQQFKALRQLVNQYQNIALNNLSQISNNTQTQLIKALQIDPQLRQKYKIWQENYFQTFIKCEGGNCEQKKNKFIQQGEQIVQHINHQQKNIYSQIQVIIQNVTMSTNQNIYQEIPNFIKLIVNQRPKQIKNNNLQQNLLDGEGQNIEGQIYPKYQQIQPKNAYILEQIQPVIKSSSQNSNVKILAKNDSKIQQPIVSNFQKLQRPNKKKLKSIKVPQKIQKILENLYADTLDTLDLTNAELGDNIITQICEFLRGSRVKTVKFIRNKLTDDVIPKIISSLGSIITLNLSQNMLTQNALQHLIVYRNHLPCLKSVILSQNKIIERKHKNHIQRLRKLDLTVSV